MTHLVKLTTTLFSIALVVAAGCGKPKDKPADKPAEPTPTAPTPKPAEPAQDPAKDSPPAPAAAPAPAEPGAAAASIKLDALPDGWTREDDGRSAKLEYVAGVNETKFPVDNAVFSFDLEPVAGTAPLPEDTSAYGNWIARETKLEVTKTDKLGDAHYFELTGPGEDGETQQRFQIVANINGTLWRCGGSLYRDVDYNKIPKIRDAAIAQAKKLCASMK